ncbi:hypothetical protein TVAG_064940 [Trichomonas vaginalis G3]|uniref:Polymorphic outer membrane protein n=1 Tax=Trichomonas vaginalis (strain ATCC PRA-98 / G3) TaxID=412133 RepID=A2EHG8_TRIV3|nr:bifunctional inhibitor/lipid-transfer protein/seed storage 2s albumin superfamily protein family [Trichomonas vaginalis G3]EAY07946.1 hypothetical protein TVAG_064940 [Trichomonas vaginalis G3]KAI5531329.1 bifunctional inhibitor/lipid-transfer protein/seed storage 2s albumin superfamily protein family [Trichomonas vaginalis G3]|eukprot:XP_001320169.1 hypothetical protein [Trichomonas vaginalis G3]
MFQLLTLAASVDFTGYQTASVSFQGSGFSDSEYDVFNCQFHELGDKEGASPVHFDGGDSSKTVTIHGCTFENCFGSLGGGLHLVGDFNLRLMFNCIIKCNVGGDQTGSIAYIKVNQPYNVSFLSSAKCGKSNEPLSLTNFLSVTQCNISSAESYNYRAISGTYGIIYITSDFENCEFSFNTIERNTSPQSIIYFYHFKYPIVCRKCNVLYNDVDTYSLIISGNADPARASSYVHIIGFYIFGNTVRRSTTYQAHNTYGTLKIEDCAADSHSYTNFLLYQRITFIGEKITLTKDEHEKLEHYTTYECYAELPHYYPPTEIIVTTPEQNPIPSSPEQNPAITTPEQHPSTEKTLQTQTASFESPTSVSPNGNNGSYNLTDKNSQKINDSKFNWIVVVVPCGLILLALIILGIYLYKRHNKDETSSDFYSEEPFHNEDAEVITDTTTVTYDNPLFTTSVVATSSDPFKNDFEEPHEDNGYMDTKIIDPEND